MILNVGLRVVAFALAVLLASRFSPALDRRGSAAAGGLDRRVGWPPRARPREPGHHGAGHRGVLLLTGIRLLLRTFA
jgi:hypothetical protein